METEAARPVRICRVRSNGGLISQQIKQVPYFQCRPHQPPSFARGQLRWALTSIIMRVATSKRWWLLWNRHRAMPFKRQAHVRLRSVGDLAERDPSGASWHIARSEAPEQDAALKEVMERWRLKVRRSLVPGANVPRPQFALVSVPTCWTSDLSNIVAHLIKGCRWPKFAPFIAVVSDSSVLSLNTLLSDDWIPGQEGPRALFLGQHALESLYRESLDPELRDASTVQISDFLPRDGIGQLNSSLTTPDPTKRLIRGAGDMVDAAHKLIERRPQDLASILLFADFGRDARVVYSVLNLLDSAYPMVPKAGLVASRKGSEPVLAFGKTTCKTGGVICLLLPGPLHSSIDLCGCTPIGTPLEVCDCDRRGGNCIRTVCSNSLENEDAGREEVVGSFETLMPPRRPIVPAAPELLMAAQNVTHPCVVEPFDFWVGVNRGSGRDQKKWRVAPGAGEWSLHRWFATTVDGSVVLEYPGPGIEGLGGKGLRWIQGFVSRPDPTVVPRLVLTYDLECQTTCPCGAPYATLLFAGGPGSRTSMPKEMLFDGVCLFGAAGIGPSGLVVKQSGEATTGAFADRSAVRSKTLVHRQAAGLVHLCK